MDSYTYLKTLVLLLTFSLQAACTIADDQNILVLFSGEDYGRLEPCGCTSGQLGGLSRRQFLIDKLLKQETCNLLLSNGDLVSGVNRQDEIKFETQVRAMDEMGYRVLNIGEKDLALGRMFLKNVQTNSKMVFLAGNLVDEKNNLLFEQVYSQKIDLNGKLLKVNIMGFLSVKYSDSLGSGLHLLSPKNVLQQMIGEGASLDELWIMLYHGVPEEAMEIVKEFPQVCLVISGHGREEFLQSPFQSENAMIVSIPVEGKYLGKCLIKVSADGTRHASAFESLPLDEKLDHSKKMDELLLEYQDQLKNEALCEKTDGRLIADKRNFIGSQKCSLCHKKMFEKWNTAAHANAYADLEKVHKNYDPDCLVCHTTGFQYTTGFSGEAKTPHLINVGCESCHGPGSLHIKSPVKNPMIRPVKENCMTCHDHENSPHFDFDVYWEKIKH